MTHHLKYFKKLTTIVALCLPLGCMNDSQSPQTVEMAKHLQSLQAQSQILEKQALGIESQIDEIRRAGTDSQSAEIETLRIQFYALKETHETLQKEMSALRAHLRQTTPSR